MAASMSGGSVSNFGTMTKPLHAGLAARDALMAISLAGRGFSANPSQLEDRNGFFEMYGDASPARLSQFADRLSHWESNWPLDWSLQALPLLLRNPSRRRRSTGTARDFDPEAAERIDVAMYAGDLAILTKGKPRTGLEAKFSLEYVAAATLLRGALSLKDFEPEAVNDPAVADLMSKIHIENEEQMVLSLARLRIAKLYASTVKTLGDVFPALDLYPTGLGEVIAVATASPAPGKEALERRAAALQERHGFRFPLPQILPRRMDKPLAQAGGDLITDDFAPADVYDVMGDRARRKK